MAYVNSASAVGTTGSDTVTLNGTGLAGGNLILVWFRIGGTTSNTAPTPAGLTLVTTLSAAGGGFGGPAVLSLYFATAPASWTWTVPGANGTTPSALAVCHSGRIVAAPTNFVTTAYHSGSASPVSEPLNGVTALLGDDIEWGGCITSSGTSGTWVTTPPSGYTLRKECSSVLASGAGGTHAVGTKDGVAAGATGTLTGSAADSGISGDYFGIVVALPVSPPIITVQPSQQAAAVGGTSTFSLTATSPSGTTLSYQWYKNGSSISGATSSSYVTGTLTSANNGDAYYCAVTDSIGTTNSLTTRGFILGLGSAGKGLSEHMIGWYKARRGVDLRPLSDQLLERNFGASHDVAQMGRTTWLAWSGFPLAAGAAALGGASLAASIAAAQVAGLGALNAASLSASLATAAVTGAGNAGGASLSASIGAATLVGVYAVGGASLSASIAAASITGLGALGAPGLSASISAATVTGRAAISAPSISVSIAAAQFTGTYAIGGGSLDASLGAATLIGTGALGARSLSATVAAAAFTIIVPFTAASLSATLAVGNLTAPGAGAFSASTLAASVAAASVLGTGALSAASLSASVATAAVTATGALGARSLSASIAAATFTASYAIGGGSLGSSIAAASVTGKGALGGSGLSATLAAAQIVGIAPISARSLSATLATAQFIAASAGVISGRSLSATVAGAFIQALITPPNSRTIETVENHRFIVTRSGARLIATADSARVLPTRSVDRLLITGAGSSARTVTQ